jgi:hypothetical protein
MGKQHRTGWNIISRHIGDQAPCQPYYAICDVMHKLMQKYLPTVKITQVETKPV